MFISYSMPCLSMIISEMFLYSFYFAMSRANLPLKARMFRSHPFSSSFLTIRPLPDIVARCKGVIPKVVSCLSI